MTGVHNPEAEVDGLPAVISPEACGSIFWPQSPHLQNGIIMQAALSLGCLSESEDSTQGQVLATGLHNGPAGSVKHPGSPNSQEAATSGTPSRWASGFTR